MALNPKKSASLISKLSKDVTICSDGIARASELILKGFIEENYGIEKWKSHKLHPKILDSSSVDWIFFVDTLNFSFWSEKNEWYEVTYDGDTYSGYWSLCAAVNRALEEGYKITSPEYYSTISMETLKHILRSDSSIEIPLLEERHRILIETGESLVKNFQGSFLTCLKMCNKSATKLLKIIASNFPSYRDEATIEGHRVSFYKRAQILIGDLWACFESKGYGAFDDIDSITMFADYRVPQVLVYLGVLKYSDDLEKRLKDGKLLESGERQEIEIRGCTIWAVEMMCDYINKLPKDTNLLFNPIMVDNYLWDYRRSHSELMEHIPFHKIRCIYY